MRFAYLAGPYTDAVFTRLGLHFTQVRYKGMVIAPNPIVSHEGTSSQSEFSSDLSSAEAVDTYTVSFPADTLAQQLTAALQAEQQTLQTRMGMGLISAEVGAAQLAIATRDYQLGYAIAAYREWALSVDKGITWKPYRTQGDPKREAVRWVIKLVSAGI